MELIDGIMSRQSVRSYTARPVRDEDLNTILVAGSRAPSGLNNQPWRFVTIRSAGIRDSLAGMTRYHRIVRSAPLLIAVYLHRESVYHEMKDYQGIGACLQNMLLAAHGCGLGAVWLGEILRNARQVSDCLGVGGGMELMALLAIGYPAGRPKKQMSRYPLETLVIREL